MEIRKAELLNVREVWKSEPRNFTKWLADNIDFLNENLEFSLNVIETEKQIGSFNVDIYCEDEQGDRVIIENQLEKTDHTHLGQILTYTVGIDAKTVIWITPEPRVEHTEVFEWLNEVTPVDNCWYLFKLEVIKLSDTTVSPLFTKIVGPSQVIKNRGNEKKEVAESNHSRFQFWETLLEQLNNNTPTYRNVSPTMDNWLNAGTGIGGINHCIIVRRNDTALQLIIEKKDTELNKKIFDYLHSFREEIEREFGERLIWRRMEEKKSSRIRFDMTDCTLDHSSWENGIPLLVNRFLKWQSALEPYLKLVGEKTWK